MKLFWKLCGDHNLSGSSEAKLNAEAVRLKDPQTQQPAQKLKGDDSWIALLVALSPFIAAIVISIIHGLIT